MYLYTPEHYADPTGAAAISRVIEKEQEIRRKRERDRHLRRLMTEETKRNRKGEGEND